MFLFSLFMRLTFNIVCLSVIKLSAIFVTYLFIFYTAEDDNVMSKRPVVYFNVLL